MNRTQKTFSVRLAKIEDLASIIELDAIITNINKSTYWTKMFEHFQNRDGRYFLVVEDTKNAANSSGLIGFIVGEIRAWEFGSQPCGWILTILVSPGHQGMGIGETLLAEICDIMKGAGVTTIRTMIARDDTLNMSFFRSQGMMAGPFIELEKPLD